MKNIVTTRSNPRLTRRPLLWLCLAALGALPVFAEDEEPLREFTVELIVFSYSGASTEEAWNYAPESEPQASTTTPAKKAALRFEREDALTLTEIYEKMRRSRDYRPLVHTAWTQPGYAAEDAPSLPLDRVARLPRDLSGKVTLHLSRYLHLNVDLALAGNRSSGASDALTLNERPIYQLQESRRMRSGDLHFFDHPRFGVIARIERAETAADGTAPAS